MTICSPLLYIFLSVPLSLSGLLPVLFSLSSRLRLTCTVDPPKQPINTSKQPINVYSSVRRTCTVDPIAQVVSPPLHQRWRQSYTHVTPHRMNQFMHTPQHVLPRPLAHPTRRVLLTSRRPPQLRRQRPPCRRPRPTCAGRGGTDEGTDKGQVRE